MGRITPLTARAYRMKQCDSECVPEIVRVLNRFRSDPEFRGKGKRVPLKQFAELARVSRKLLYDLMRGDQTVLEFHTRDRILHAIALVVHGGLRWYRKFTPSVREVKILVPYKIDWLPKMPDGEPPPLIKRRERVFGMRPGTKLKTRKRAANDRPHL